MLGAKYFGVEFAERIDTTAVIYRTPVSCRQSSVCGRGHEWVRYTDSALRLDIVRVADSGEGARVVLRIELTLSFIMNKVYFATSPWTHSPLRVYFVGCSQ